MSSETTELGFPVDVEERAIKLRGTYDGSRLPEAAKVAISALLTLPGVKVETIAKELGTSWETVAAIRQQCSGTIREFKAGLSAQLRTLIDLALPAMQAKAKEGKYDPVQIAILIDKILILEGEASSVIEHRHTVSPALQAFMQEAPRIGSAAGKLPPMEPSRDRLPLPSGAQVIEAETVSSDLPSPDNSK